MSQHRDWIKTERLVPREECELAAAEMVEITTEGAQDVRLETRARCAEILRVTLQNHGERLKSLVSLLKPDPKLSDCAIGKFRPNPVLARPSTDVFVFIALTRLEKANGLFSFLAKPDDDTNPQTEWEEENVVIEPGEALVWRGDCARKVGEGHGGTMLVIRYR